MFVRVSASQGQYLCRATELPILRARILLKARLAAMNAFLPAIAERSFDSSRIQQTIHPCPPLFKKHLGDYAHCCRFKPTGTVTFLPGSQELAVAPLSNGTARLTRNLHAFRNLSVNAPPSNRRWLHVTAGSRIDRPCGRLHHVEVIVRGPGAFAPRYTASRLRLSHDRLWPPSSLVPTGAGPQYRLRSCAYSLSSLCELFLFRPCTARNTARQGGYRSA